MILFCLFEIFVLVAVIVLTVPSCIDFIDHNNVYFPHYYSLLHGCTVWIFSTNGETQNIVDFVMHRRRLDGHCTGSTGLFLLSLYDKCFALAVGYNQACNFFHVTLFLNRND